MIVISYFSKATETIRFAERGSPISVEIIVRLLYVSGCKIFHGKAATYRRREGQLNRFLPPNYLRTERESELL